MYQLVRSPPCCRPPGSAAPPSPSWELKVTGCRKHGFRIKMMDLFVSQSCHVCKRFRTSLMERLKNRIAQNVKPEKTSLCNITKPNPHICSSFVPFREHREAGCNRASTWKVSVVKNNPPTHCRLNPARMFTSSTNQTKKKKTGMGLDSASNNCFSTHIFSRFLHPYTRAPNYSFTKFEGGFKNMCSWSPRHEPISV